MRYANPPNVMKTANVGDGSYGYIVVRIPEDIIKYDKPNSCYGSTCGSTHILLIRLEMLFILQ
jgi:hypothetical protein